MPPWLAPLLSLTLALAACQGDARPSRQERTVPDLLDIRADLAFTCTHEKDAIPPRDPEAEQLYLHARWLKKNNLRKEVQAAYPVIERLIRIATAHGHDKANLELRQMIGKGQAPSENIIKETLDLTEELIRRGIPGGYYDMGRYLEKGYGVKKDPELALKYYRKSADLGSPEGQYLIADKLAPIDIAPDIARQMRRCASEQGHGEAAHELGIDLKFDKLYLETLLAYQLSVKAGNQFAASALADGFNGPAPDDRLNYLAQTKDPERVRRYEAIGKVLSDYSYLNPKVPEIDAIVPLPPAKLPPWDGTLKWLKEHEANVPPPLPAEERIVEMARAKGLDPATGRPLPPPSPRAAVEPTPAPTAAPAFALGTRLASRARCPQSGLWLCDEATTMGGPRRAFAAGETLPEALVPVKRSLRERLQGAPEYRLVDTSWTLVELPAKERG